MERPYALGYVATHPIQYQAPMLRAVDDHPEIDLTAIFLSDHSLEAHEDPGFESDIEWDVPLLEGYDHEFLPGLGGGDSLSFLQPLVHRVGARLDEHDLDALWVHGYYHNGLLRAIRAASKRDIPVLLRGESNLHHRGQSPVRRIKDAVIRWILDHVDAALAIGTWNRRFYEAFGFPDDRIFDVPYAVDNDRFARGAETADTTSLREDLGLEPDRPIVLYVAKLIERKRPGDLLEAIDALHRNEEGPDPALVYVGDGPLRPDLEARAEASPAEVRFAGFQNQSDLPAYYALADAFVLPSEHEAWGLVVNEAMACGCPVVVSHGVAAGADLVEDGENGYTYAVGDVDRLAQSLREVLGDPERVREMGKRSREIVDRWGFEEDVEGLLDALDVLDRA